jgi:hypothetical protein
MFATAGLLVLNLGILVQALVPLDPQQEGSADVTERIRHLTKASTSIPGCLGKNKKYFAPKILYMI